MTLERLGYTVFAASEAHEALELFIRERINLIILDLVLPVYSGKELLTKIRHIDRDVNVIITSGQDFDRNKDVFNDLGVIDYIPKPFTINELALSVRNALERKAK